MGSNTLFKQYLNAQYNNYYDEAEKICNETVLTKPPPDKGVYCPAHIDRWGICFNYTKPGVTLHVPCPPFLNPEELAFLHCNIDGKWQVNSIGQKWTNLTACTQNTTIAHEGSDYEKVGYVYIFIALASLSLVLLTISLAIFFGFRQLRCDRITIHKNLFISYILAAVTSILYKRLAVLEGDVLLHNPMWCQLLHILAQMFFVTNFSWMFCEGLYLHIIMEHALRTGKKLIKCLVIGGWSVPILLTGIYGLVRWSTQRSTHSCWIHEDILLWITAGPIVASVIINICILVNLVRLLMTKLRQIPDAAQNRKTVKATLILVPLLGLQFLVFPVNPGKGSKMHMVYLYTMAILNSSQGILVSIIFCFCNGEVRSIIRRKWLQHKMMTGGARKNTGVTSSTFVDGYSMVDSTRGDGSYVKSKGTQENNHKNIEAVELKANPIVTTPLVQNENGVDMTVNCGDDSAGSP